jgi:hypothetical protein
MQRFYFDFATDDTGTELRDVAEAQLEAIAAAGEWIKDKTASGTAAELMLSIRDGGTTPIFVVKASVRISQTHDQ